MSSCCVMLNELRNSGVGRTHGIGYFSKVHSLRFQNHRLDYPLGKLNLVEVYIHPKERNDCG